MLSSLIGLFVVAHAASIPQQFNPIKLQYTDGRWETEVAYGGGSIAATIDTGSATWNILSSAYSPGSDAVQLNETITMQYVSGSVVGTMVLDTVAVGELGVLNFPIVVSDDNLVAGIVGLGLPGCEATVGPSSYVDGKLTNDYYETFTKQLQNEGDIGTAAFSLWYNAASDYGNLLFGAVDTGKYDGTLSRLPLLKTNSIDFKTGEVYTPGEPWQYSIALNAVTIQSCNCTGGEVITDAHLPVLLDSGSTFSLLSPKFVGGIASSLNSTDHPLIYDADNHYYLTDKVPEGRITFDFSGVLIECPVSDFFYPVATFTDGRTTYAFTMFVNDVYTDIDDPRGTQILGSDFLQNAYIVYSEQDLEVSLAKAKRGDVATAIVAFESATFTEAPRYSETQWNGDFTVKTVSF